MEPLEPLDDPDFEDVGEYAKNHLMEDPRILRASPGGSDFAGEPKDILWQKVMQAVYGEQEFKEWYRELRFGDIDDTIEVENPCCDGTIEVEVDEMEEWGRGGKYDGKMKIMSCPGEDCTQNIEIFLRPGGEVESKLGQWIYER